MASPASFQGHTPHFESSSQFSFVDYNSMQMPGPHMDLSSALREPLISTAHTSSYPRSHRLSTAEDIQLAQRRHQAHQANQVRRSSKLRRRHEGPARQGPLNADAHRPKFDVRSDLPDMALSTTTSNAPSSNALMRPQSHEIGSSSDTFGYSLQNQG
ncbi:MAG: hypothetical protein M4579_001419 [Chaenotheca gracillima]|nr:MAG: hypothetical protein M4579_001419 [Chaenotheca gracillima]